MTSSLLLPETVVLVLVLVLLPFTTSVPPVTVVEPVYKFSPSRVSEPEPLLISLTFSLELLSEITPENVELLEEFTVRILVESEEESLVIDPAELPFKLPTETLYPLRFNTPLFMISVAPIPKALLLLTTTLPLLISVYPEYVLFPLSTRLPVPSFTTEHPEITSVDVTV